MKDKKNIIFVGGIHGVGKTTFCNNLSKELSLEHFSSSTLISMLDSQRIKQNKRVDDIKNNQSILLEAVNYFLNSDRVYLLDGHFCLIDGNSCIQKIPISVFELLGIKGIILLFDCEEKILKKFKKRDARDYSLEFIKKFQEEEMLYAKYVAKKIKVPLRVINISKKEEDKISIVRELLDQ